MALGFFSPRSIYMPWIRRGMLGVTATAALIGTGLVADLSKSDWASWVQAVGSILAVIGAAAIARYQHQLEERRARRSALERKIDVLSLVQQTLSAHTMLEDLQVPADELKVRIRWDYVTEMLNPPRLQSVIDMATLTPGMPISLWPTLNIVRHSLGTFVLFTKEADGALHQREPLDPEQIESAIATAKYLQEDMLAASAAVAKALEQLNTQIREL